MRYAERDVNELAKELRPAGYEIRLLKGSSKGKEHASLANIRSALDEMLQNVQATDLVLVALAVVVRDATLLVAGENGIGKRTPFDMTLEDGSVEPVYRLQSRGGKGIITMKTGDKTGVQVAPKQQQWRQQPNDLLVSAAPAPQNPQRRTRSKHRYYLTAYAKNILGYDRAEKY